MYEKGLQVPGALSHGEFIGAICRVPFAAFEIKGKIYSVLNRESEGVKSELTVAPDAIPVMVL